MLRTSGCRWRTNSDVTISSGRTSTVRFLISVMLSRATVYPFLALWVSVGQVVHVALQEGVVRRERLAVRVPVVVRARVVGESVVTLVEWVHRVSLGAWVDQVCLARRDLLVRPVVLVFGEALVQTDTGASGAPVAVSAPVVAGVLVVIGARLVLVVAGVLRDLLVVVV